MNRYRERDRDYSSDSDDEILTSMTRVHKSKSQSPVSAAVMDTDAKPAASTINSTTKRKVNNIWSSVVQEQTINDDLGKVSMNRLSDRLGWERGCESYDFTQKANDTRPDSDSSDEIDLDYGVSDIENEFESSETNYPNSDTPVKKKKASPKLKITLLERQEDAVRIARNVARKLREPKVELIERCVEALGRKKVFELLNMTQDIEENGGMLIVNGTRRRTPGGVFFYQLRKDTRIGKAEKDYVFAEDRARYAELKKAQRKLLRRKEARMSAAKSGKMAVDSVEPKMEVEAGESVPSASENIPDTSASTKVKVESEEPVTQVSELASDVELEEGEIL